jgi:hypothetical protein
MQTRLITALSAVTATTTSDAINVKYAKKIVLMLTCAAQSSGNGVFTVSGSVDNGTTYVALAILRDNVVGINTLVASKTLSANGTAIVALDLESGFAFDYLKVTATRTTDGTYSAKIYIAEG